MTTLEQLLSQPLAAIADNGFSRQVMAKINAYQQRRLLSLSVVCLLLTISLFLLFPVTNWIESFTSGSVQLANDLMPSNLLTAILAAEPAQLILLLSLTVIPFTLLSNQR